MAADTDTAPVRRATVETRLSVPRRPMVLWASLAVALVSALTALADGVVVLLIGHDYAIDLAVDAVAQLTGKPADVVRAASGAILEDSLAPILDNLHSRAILSVIFGAVLLVATLLTRNASVWGRALVTVAALTNAVLALRIATDPDGGNAPIHALAWATLITGLLAAVIVWLPANHYYAQDRREALAS